MFFSRAKNAYTAKNLETFQYSKGVLFQRSHRDLESGIQIALARYLDSKGVLFCASAGGARMAMSTAKRMKAMGYKAGFPDIFIYASRSRKNPKTGRRRWLRGLALELKGPGGYPSPEQRAWAKGLRRQGYAAKICPGTFKSPSECLDWAYKQVDEYMGWRVRAVDRAI